MKEGLISKDQADEMKQQIAMEALQTGAKLAYGAFGKAGEIHGAIKSKVENSRYRSFEQRGWVDRHGKAQGDNWLKALDGNNLELMFHTPIRGRRSSRSSSGCALQRRRVGSAIPPMRTGAGSGTKIGSAIARRP